jgi:hypothetical protein
MRDVQTPVSPYPPYPHPHRNREKSLLEHIGLAPQRSQVPPQSALSEVLSTSGTGDALEVRQADNPAIEEVTSQSDIESFAAQPVNKDARTLSDVEFEKEARRIARELLKLYHAGVITSAEDPNAVFYACLIRDFGATVQEHHGPREASANNSEDHPPPGVFVPGKPYTPTEEHRVRIPFGLAKEEQRKWLQADLDSLND